MIPFPELPTSDQLRWHLQARLSDESLQPWCDELIEAVHGLSSFLLKHTDAKAFPEIIALGFWARQRNIRQIAAQQSFVESKRPAKVFHIGPANVDTVYFYSFLLSFLSANQNIVRISNRSGAAVYELLRLLQGFLQQHPDSLLGKRVSVLEYPADQEEVTQALSAWADMRVIWGGDDSIQAINRIAPHVNQLNFPDRYSIALLRVENEDQVEKAVEGMCKDLLPFRQQACSSPKAIFWLKTPKVLQSAFFNNLNKAIAKSVNGFDMRDQVEQFVDCQRIAIVNQVTVLSLEHSQLTHLELMQIPSDVFNSHSGHGLILSTDIDTPESLPFADKLQTIAVFNIPVFMQDDLIANHYVKRVVPLGEALSFHHIWDGVDLCQAFGKLRCR